MLRPVTNTRLVRGFYRWKKKYDTQDGAGLKVAVTLAPKN